LNLFPALISKDRHGDLERVNLLVGPAADAILVVRGKLAVDVKACCLGALGGFGGGLYAFCLLFNILTEVLLTHLLTYLPLFYLEFGQQKEVVDRAKGKDLGLVEADV
jgi:hypothetical protein